MNLSALLAGALVSASLAAAGTLELADCAPAGPTHPMRCGRLAVPESRDGATGRTIALNVVIVPATGPKTLPPLYYLEGGPGIGASGGAGFWATDGASHVRHRDVVLIDQRGTGHSAPLLCPEVRIGNPLVPTLDKVGVRACHDRLSAQADLSHYSTAESVADLDAVRAALSHERIDLAGLSYGTRVAQEYLRAHPDRVRAVALLGSLSPDQNLPLPFARTGQAVLDRIAQQCAADAGCHGAVPDLAADIKSVDRALRQHDAKLQAGPFWEGVRALLVETASQRRLPWLLHQAALGHFDPIVDAMTARGPSPGADGLLLSVSCPEDTLHISGAEVKALSQTVFGTYRVWQQLDACREWKVPRRDPRRDFVRGQTPVLLMAGSMDHVTPPEWAEKIAAGLPNARVVMVPLLGHFPAGLSHMECYDEVIAEFFEKGSAAELHLECIRAMQAPPFATKG
jgi:pimeloyl-ACP methyl ester carboxylesterase